MTYVCAVLFGAFPAAEVWPKLGNSTEFFCSDLIKNRGSDEPLYIFYTGGRIPQTPCVALLRILPGPLTSQNPRPNWDQYLASILLHISTAWLCIDAV